MKLSIVITAYNVENYIEQCIKSVLAQNIKNNHDLEIIIVEDKSTDNTKNKIQNAVKDYSSFITVKHNESNVGAGLSRRFGIEESTGDYIMLLDGDDYLIDKNHLQNLLDTAERTNADVVSGGIRIQHENGSYDITSYGTCSCEGYDKLTKFWGERIVFMNNKIIRKTMYNKVPYCHRRYIEDTPVIIPILWYANKVEYIDSIGYVYRMRPDSLTHEADKIKNCIFKGLCWCDLVEFFNKVDPKVFDYINIKGFIANIINILNNYILTPNILQPYVNEFAEFSMKLINTIQITGINFKQTTN